MLGMLILGIFSFLALFYCSYTVFGLIYGKNVTYRRNEVYAPTVSLVIPTKNEEDTIQRKIDNILDLDYPREKLEAVFVDSSEDKTREIIKKFKKHSPVHVVLLKGESRGLASALNLGYAAANGEIIIKTDCDMVLRKDFVKNIVTYFSDPNIGAVSGAIEVQNQSDIEVGYRSIFEKLRLAEANFDSTYIFNAFAFRKSLVEHIDEKSVADDAELALKIRKRGHRTVYAPDAIIYEPSPTSIKARIRKKSRRAQGHIRLACQNMKALFNPKYGRFGLVIFPANFLMIIVLPWLTLIGMVLMCVWLYSSFNLSSFPMIFLIVLGISIAYVKSTPKFIAGFIDSQIGLLVGSLKLVTIGPEFHWKKINAHIKSGTRK